jgi:hypothetical protein
MNAADGGIADLGMPGCIGHVHRFELERGA